MEVDGTREPSKCVLIGKTGKERMRTELRKIERLATLPADLHKGQTLFAPLWDVAHHSTYAFTQLWGGCQR